MIDQVSYPDITNEEVIGAFDYVGAVKNLVEARVNELGRSEMIERFLDLTKKNQENLPSDTKRHTALVLEWTKYRVLVHDHRADCIRAIGHQRGRQSISIGDGMQIVRGV